MPVLRGLHPRGTGRRYGELVPSVHPGVLENGRSGDFPFTYEWAKKRLQEYGLQVKEDRHERLRLDIYLKSRDSDTHYKFEAYCYQGESDIPFLN